MRKLVRLILPATTTFWFALEIERGNNRRTLAAEKKAVESILPSAPHWAVCCMYNIQSSAGRLAEGVDNRCVVETFFSFSIKLLVLLRINDENETSDSNACLPGSSYEPEQPGSSVVLAVHWHYHGLSVEPLAI